MSRIAQPPKGTSPPVAVNTTPTSAAPATVVAPTIANNHMERMEKLVSRLESIASRLENTSTSSVQSKTSAPVDVDKPSIIAFNDIINGSLKSFFDLSVQIGGDVAKIADMVKNLFILEKSLLTQAVNSMKPSDDVFGKALEPLSKVIGEIQSFREKNRKSEHFNHLSAISESIGALGWVTVSPAPCTYIKEMNDAGQFFTNRVLKDYKEKDPSKLHANWVHSWIKTINELQACVKEHHTTGVSWNPRGGSFDSSKVSSSGSAPPSAPKGGAPPPPPPPPIPSFDLLADQPASNQDDILAKLQKELNVGTDITKTLRKVNDDQKTHKNTALRAGNTVPGEISKPKSQTPQSAPVSLSRPPKFELSDKKWIIEFQQGQNNLMVDNTELKQTVYIYKCKECTITVKGKVNSILVDSCERVGVLFDDVLSTIEFINSKNVQAQVTGKVPTVSIDKTDGCQMYLSKQSIEAEIVTSKSSAMNILIPTSIEGDYLELPLPEQYKTKIINNKVHTEPTETA